MCTYIYTHILYNSVTYLFGHVWTYLNHPCSSLEIEMFPVVFVDVQILSSQWCQDFGRIPVIQELNLLSSQSKRLGYAVEAVPKT